MALVQTLSAHAAVCKVMVSTGVCHTLLDALHTGGEAMKSEASPLPLPHP